MKFINLIAILAITVTVLCTSQTNSKKEGQPKERNSAPNSIPKRIRSMSDLSENKDSEQTTAKRTRINSSAMPFGDTGNTLESVSEKSTKDEGNQLLDVAQLSLLSPEEFTEHVLSICSSLSSSSRVQDFSATSSIKDTLSEPQNDNAMINMNEPAVGQESKNSSTNHIKQHLSDKDSTMNYFELNGSDRKISKEYSSATELIFDYNSNDYSYNFYPCTNLAVFRLHSNIDVLELDKVLLLMNYDLNVMEIKSIKEKDVKLTDIGLISNFYKLTSLSLNHITVDYQSSLFCNLSFIITLTKVSFTDSPIGNEFVNWLKINTDKLPWKELYLINTQLTQKAAEILLNCDSLDQLELLDLSDNGIDYSNLKVPTYKRPSLRVIVANNRKCMETLTKIKPTEE